MDKIHFKVDEIHCSSCFNIENALMKIKGIYGVSPNFRSKEVIIEYESSEISGEQIKKILQNKGFTLTTKENFQRRKIKLIICLILTFALILISAYELPYYKFMIIFLASIVQFYGGFEIYKKAAFSIIYRKINFNTLACLGISLAYLYLIYSAIYNIRIHNYIHLSTSSVIVSLLILKEILEYFLLKIIRQSPFDNKLVNEFVNVLRNKKEARIKNDELKDDDIIIVNPGEIIPFDGFIVSGNSNVNESNVTWSDNLVTKNANDMVYGNTINKSNKIYFKASNLKDLIYDNVKKDFTNLHDPFSEKDILKNWPAIIFFLSIISFCAWYYLKEDFVFSLAVLISTLIITNFCAFSVSLFSPLMHGSKLSLKNGILIKDSNSVGKLENSDVILFTKHGILTRYLPEIHEIIPVNRYAIKDVLKYAAIAEQSSNNPISSIIKHKALKEGINLDKAHEFKEHQGFGVEARYYAKYILVGNKRFHNNYGTDLYEFEPKINSLEKEGKNVVIVSLNKKVVGLIVLSYDLRDNATEVINDIQKLKNEVIMITSDNVYSADFLATKLGIKTYAAQLTKSDKIDYIKKFQNQGKLVCLVGKDDELLSKADISVAMLSEKYLGSNIILLRRDLNLVIKTIELSNKINNKVKQNLYFGFFYNSFGVAVSSVIYPIMGFSLNPVFATIAMISYTVFVLVNSLNAKK